MRVIVVLAVLIVAVPAVAEEEVGRCTALYDRMIRAVEQMNSCFDHTDCIAPFIGCPLGCGTPVNKHADLELLRLMHKDYGRECEACVYQCSGQLRALDCVEGRCVMDFSDPHQKR